MSISTIFGNSFGTIFLSMFLVALIFSLLVPPWLRFLKRPKLKLFFQSNRKTELFLAKASDGGYEISFSLYIKNDSLSAFNPVHGYIFLPDSLQISIEKGDPNLKIKVSSAKGYKRIHAFVMEPVFPERYYSYPAEIKIKLPSVERNAIEGNIINLHYYFCTELGVSPRKARGVVNNFDEKIDLSKLDYVTLVIPS